MKRALESEKAKYKFLFWHLLPCLWKKPIVAYVKWEQKYLAFDTAVKLRMSAYKLFITKAGNSSSINEAVFTSSL